MANFLRDIEEYRREIGVVDGYFEQTEKYLQLMSGIEPERIKAWMQKKFGKGGTFEFKPPVVNITIRDRETGDRRPSQTNMAKLLQVVEKNKLIMSPSMTVYLPPEQKQSLLAVFVDANIKARGKIKEEMLAAKSAGDLVLAANKDNEQTSKKTRNNGLSGAHCSPSTSLYNKSTHSSLTSLCRSATSYGNANNEKVLSGNRHYWAPGIVINNILSTISLTDFAKFTECVEHYGLYIPSVDDVMELIEYSTEALWQNGRALNRIRDLVSRIEPIERAAFVYIGDMYHLAKFNEELVKTLLAKLTVRVESLEGVTAEEMKQCMDGDTKAYVSLLCADWIGSNNFGTIKENDPALFTKLAHNCVNVHRTIGEYLLLIREILTTRNVPASIAKMPEALRRVSLVSDTDSTMATAQWWSEWYCGKGNVTGREADAVADAMIYIAVQNITHMMARMSKNMGMSDHHVFRYAMKNEYKFSSFCLTNKAKHYFALITSREGTIYTDPELEVKGVALRTSNIPPVIMNEFRSTITDISSDVMNGRKIKIIPLLERVAEIEDGIVASVHNGEYTYLKTGQIKTKEAYSEPDSSAYFYHVFWEATFAGKYGSPGEPAYDVVKLAVNLNTKTEVKRWLENMKDRELAGRLQQWFDKTGKTYIQILLPEAIVSQTGIPKEILDVVNYRRIVFSSVEPYYHILEALGVPLIDDNRTILVSDYYSKAKLTDEALLLQE